MSDIAAPSMNDSTHVRHRPRRAWPVPARTAVTIIAIAAAALLAAACSSNPSSAGPGGSPSTGESAASPSAVAYSSCMRSHGVPNYPDPTTLGGVPTLPKTSAQQLGVSRSQLQTAQQACQHLYPSNGGSFHQAMAQCEMTGDCPQAVVQHALNIMRKYARCMRSHGLPNWPDPTLDSQGRPFFNVSKAGMSHQFTHSSLVQSKDGECERLVGGSAGVPVPLG